MREVLPVGTEDPRADVKARRGSEANQHPRLQCPRQRNRGRPDCWHRAVGVGNTSVNLCDSAIHRGLRRALDVQVEAVVGAAALARRTCAFWLEKKQVGYNRGMCVSYGSARAW